MTKDLSNQRTGRLDVQQPSFQQLQSTIQNGDKNGFGRPQRAVEVDLTKHIISGLQILFDSIKTFVRDVYSLFVVNLERVQNPLQVIDSIFRARHQTVAQQIIHSVAVKLTGYQLSHVCWLVFVVDYLHDLVGKVWIESAQPLINF